MPPPLRVRRSMKRAPSTRKAHESFPRYAFRVRLRVIAGVFLLLLPFACIPNQHPAPDTGKWNSLQKYLAVGGRCARAN